MRISYDVIEIDNYVILSTLQNLHFREYSIFVYRFGLKTYQTLYTQNIKHTNIILITKYLNLNLNIVKKLIFYLKKGLILNNNFQKFIVFRRMLCVHIASFYDKVHISTIDWVLVLDIHVQICVPQNN